MSTLLSNNNRILDTIRPDPLTDLHALQFDGSANSYGSSATLTIGTEASIEIFFKPTTVDATIRFIFGFGTSGSADRFYVTTSAANKIVVQTRTTVGGVLYTTTGTTTIVANTLYHVCATYSSVDLKVRLYVNGVEEANTTIVSNSIGNRILQIAGTGAGSSISILDNARFYTRKLSAAEVADHYIGVFSDNTSLSVNWKMDTGFGTGISDMSGNNFHCDLMSTSTISWVTRLVDF